MNHPGYTQTNKTENIVSTSDPGGDNTLLLHVNLCESALRIMPCRESLYMTETYMTVYREYTAGSDHLPPLYKCMSRVTYKPGLYVLFIVVPK